MNDMPEEMPIPAFAAGYEDPRAHAREAPHCGQPRPQDVSRVQNPTTCADTSAATDNDLRKLAHAPAGVLPSDLVNTPTRSDGSGNYATMMVVMLALVVIDIFACMRAGVNTLLIIGGRAPERCRKACLFITHRQTRTTCGRPCCLPEDHGSVWNHSCPDHVQFGGRVSTSEYKTFMLFKWWQRILASVKESCQLVTRTVWKWGACRWAMSAVMLWLIYTTLLAPRGLYWCAKILQYSEPKCLCVYIYMHAMPG